MRTYDTARLAERTLDTDDIRLPTGMGVGALRFKIAEAVRDHWDQIREDGAVDTVREHAEDFLGDAADPEDMLDENGHLELPFDAQQTIYSYLHAWMTRHQQRFTPNIIPPSPDNIDDMMGDALVDSLCSIVAQHIRNDIQDQTGIDSDAWQENKKLQQWGVQ